jgi:hypothetical protein
MATHAHLVGSIGLDTVDEVFSAAGIFERDFGIASQCGFAQGNTMEQVRERPRIHAGALGGAGAA